MDTGAVNRAPTLSSGAGPPPKNPPAPATGHTCASSGGMPAGAKRQFPPGEGGRKEGGAPLGELAAKPPEGEDGATEKRRPKSAASFSCGPWGT